ncbi:MAG: zinc ribbon domain-containing protein [Phycisphaeraceae bacterium]
MPTYEYLCQACEHQFDEFQSITAKPLRKCPECGKQKLQRLIGTGAGIIFKGSGFYETDYRSDAYQKSAKAETDAGKPKDDKKTDTKSATDGTKTETKAEKPAAKPTKSGEKPTKS